MRGALKGAAAKKIVRREALPIATEHI